MMKRWMRLALVAVLVAPAQAWAADDPRRAVEAAFERWRGGQGSLFNDLLDPEVVWTIEGSGPYAGVYRGRADLIDRAVTPFSRRIARPIVPTVHRMWSDTETVAVHWSGEATACDGRPYRNDYVWIFTMRGGKATAVTAFLDLAPYEDVIRRISSPCT